MRFCHESTKSYSPAESSILIPAPSRSAYSNAAVLANPPKSPDSPAESLTYSERDVKFVFIKDYYAYTKSLQRRISGR